MPDHLPGEDLPDLGACCACEQTGPQVRTLVMLDKRVPAGQEGTGWGCFQCHLPMDGACVVLCDACFDREADARFVILGYPDTKQRLPIEALPQAPFRHDYAYHPECWAWSEAGSDTCGVCGEQLPDEDAWDEATDQPDLPLHLWRDEGREGLQMHMSCAQRCFQAGTLDLPGRRQEGTP
jgi:hypothetical protein